MVRALRQSHCTQLELWICPRPQQIHETCKQVAAEFQRPTNMATRQEQAEEMAHRYVSHYLRHSKLARLAEQEGWVNPLTNFVSGSGSVQAQFLCEVDPIGWDTSIAEHLGEFHSSQAAYQMFRPTIAGAIERGRIGVRVPPTLIRSWKEQSQIDEHSVGRQSGGRFAS